MSQDNRCIARWVCLSGGRSRPDGGRLTVAGRANFVRLFFFMKCSPVFLLQGMIELQLR
jgi:hypothetical protein